METGLFFGSFNPVHIGHLALAEYMTEHTPLREVWFVVSPHNPLKVKETLLDDNLRLEMVHLAVDDDKRFRVSDIEFRMPRPSYTVDTLTYLTEKYPKNSFSLIMGEDNLETFHKWKNSEFIIDNYHRYIYPRISGTPADPAKHRNCSFIPAPRIEVSSSLIRQSIRDGKSVRHLLPPKVWEFIDKMNLYRK